MYEQELDQGRHPDVSIVQLSLDEQVRADTFLAKLVNDQTLNQVAIRKTFLGILEADSLSKLTLKTDQVSKGLELGVGRLSDLDFKLISSGKLVLDVL